MQKRDELLQAILSFIVPFYILYWLYVTAKEVNAAYNRPAPSIVMLIVPSVLTFIALIAGFIAMVAAGASGSETALGGTIIFWFFGFMALCLISLVFQLIYYYKFSAMAESVLGPESSTILNFILFWFFAPAAVYLIQDKLNALLNMPFNPHTGQQQQNWQYPTKN